MPSNKKRKKEKKTKKLPQIKRYKIITDPKLLEEYNKLTPWICPTETEETYDTKLIKKDILKKSEEAVGQDSPILIAICTNDPYRDSNSEQRVHMRIINGRHRYKQNPEWKREYILINDFQEYCKYRLNYDIKKKPNRAELKMLLRMQGEDLIKQGVPLEKIGSTICQNLQGRHKSEILPLLPDEWKDQIKANNRRGKSKQKDEKKIDEKFQQEFESLKAEKQRLEQEVENLKAENQRLKNDNAEITESTQKTLRDNALQSGNDSSRLKILEAGQVVEVKGLKFMIKVEKGGTNFDVEESN